MSAKIQAVYPLTPAQAGILFHTLGALGSGQYVVQIGLELSGSIDSNREQSAWAALVMRHDVLRTAFAWEGQKHPLQVVGSMAIPSVTVNDLSGLDATAQDIAIKTYRNTDREQGFDLRKAPLLRVCRFDLGKGQHRLIVTFHHVVLDGWSIPLLLRDWIALYAGRDLPPVGNFKDYLGWLHHQDKNAAQDFWANALAGLEDVPPIPLPAPKTTTTARGECGMELSEQVTKRLTKLAHDHRLTVSTLVQGLWAIVQARYQDRDDVVYGLTRAGRPAALPGSDSRVGMFLNTLPMRAKIDGSTQLVDWLATQQSAHLAQQPYEHAALVDVHTASPIPHGAPLMQSVVVFENYPSDPALLGQADGLSVDRVEITEQTNFPLALFAQLGRTLDLKLLFDGQTICAEAAQRMLTHLAGLFDVLIETPDCQLSDLCLLNAKETELLNTRGCGPYVDADPMSISAKIAAQPVDAVAIQGDQSLSYGTLNAQANRIANHLISKGITKGEAVGICLHRSALIPAAMLGILRAGASYVPLDPTYPLGRLEHIANDSDLRTILCNSDTEATCTRLSKTPLNLTGELREASDTLPAPTATDADRAYLIYTSGSTGSPKGVPIHHGALKNLLSSFQSRLDLGADHNWLAVTTLSFDIATLEMLLPLVSGATLVIPSDTDVRDPTRLRNRIERHNITHMQATPSTWRLLIEGGWPGSPLTALCGGEALDPALAQDLLGKTGALWNVYGPTETTIWSTALQVSPEMIADGQVPIGGTLDNTSLSICDSYGNLMSDGVPGELCIGGAGLSLGYQGRDDLTADRFVTTQTGERLYRTGDQARWRADGTLDYLGRMDTQTKLRGHRIELGEVETALIQHHTVEQAVVIIAGEGATARMVAFLRQNAGTTDQQMRDHLADLLPAYMLPNRYERIEGFPQTLNGKVDRKALVAMALTKQPVTTGPLNFDEPMATLATIWRDLLQQDQVTSQDSFFDLGGHSLLIVTLQDRIRTDLNQHLEITDLFRFPTLQAQADHIAHLQGLQPETPDTDRIETRTQARATGKDRLRQRRAARTKQRPEHV